MMSLFLSAGSASIGTFLQSFQETLANYGSLATAIIGLAMVVVGIYQVAKGLMSGGKGQTNWIMTIGLILVGGALALSGGWKMVGNFVGIGNTTLNDMSQGKGDTNAQRMDDPFASVDGGGN